MPSRKKRKKSKGQEKEKPLYWIVGIVDVYNPYHVLMGPFDCYDDAWRHMVQYFQDGKEQYERLDIDWRYPQPYAWFGVEEDPREDFWKDNVY